MSNRNVFPQCFSSPGGLCGDGGRTVFTADASIPNLVAYYDFDDAFGLDKSGYAGHPNAPQPDVGPGFDGRGQSARFGGSDSFVVPHTPVFDGLRQMAVSFWIYLLTEPTESWRIVFRKVNLLTSMHISYLFVCLFVFLRFIELGYGGGISGGNSS
jgi:hypothetical protein